MNKTTSCLPAIADISGYTLPLSASELNHAQHILGTLLHGLTTPDHLSRSRARLKGNNQGEPSGLGPTETA